MRSFTIRCLVAGGCLSILAGCGGEDEVTVYTTPKDERPQATGNMPNAPFTNGGSGSGNMANMSLPESAMAQADNPDWTPPESWQESEGSSVRRASFAVTQGEQSVDISVTTFPGDVGGLTQNINRWRSQVGLPGLSSAEVENAVTPIEDIEGDWLLAEMANGDQATIAALTMHEGNSWFFKMTGHTALVEAEKSNFLQFVRSVQF